MASLAVIAAVPQSIQRTKCQDFADPTSKLFKRKPSIDSSDSYSTDAGSIPEPSLRGSMHSSSPDCWEAWDDVSLSNSAADEDTFPSTCREAKDFDYVEDGGPSFAIGPCADDDYAVDSDPLVVDLHSSFIQHTTTTLTSLVNWHFTCVDSDPLVADLHSSFIQHTTTKPTSLVNGHSTCHNVPRPLRLGLMGRATVLNL